MTPLRPALLLALLATSAVAQDYGPSTCLAGFVWREAFDGDTVCVTPETRAQAAADNQRAAARVDPLGAYGPNTCLPGYVWREARADDVVCVSPETRSQTAADNGAADSRYVRRRSAAAARVGGIQRADSVAVVEAPIAVIAPTPPMSSAPPSQRGSVRRGFDDDGRPYVEETLADGSVRREDSNGVTIIQPDGSHESYRNSYSMINAPYLTPPSLPSDPAMGRAWLSELNGQLFKLIEALVHENPEEMQKFASAEGKAVGEDLFGQIEFRARVLQTLAKL